jgi:hypothetical protein
MDYDLPTPVGMGTYGGEQKMVRMPTMKERLELAVRQAEEKLTAAKRAKEIFDKHPELEELLDILQRSHF